MAEVRKTQRGGERRNANGHRVHRPRARVQRAEADRSAMARNKRREDYDRTPD